MNEKIKELIRQKRPNMDEQSLIYFANYFSVVIKDELLPKDMNIEEVIEHTLSIADRIVFYDENAFITSVYGSKIKGLCEPKTHTLYVRKNLDDVLKEITIYHEMHHAAQMNEETYQDGINQDSNKARLIMEAQTQYMAEKVYQEIHGVTFEDKEVLSQDLRMLPGGKVLSNLHNYEMYDNILSKLAIVLGVSKDYFVTINYQYKNDIGLNDFKRRYDKAKEKYELPIDFEKLLINLDYVYVVDYFIYLDGEDGKTLASGGIVKDVKVRDESLFDLTTKNQQSIIKYIDTEFFFQLLINGGNYGDFAKYIIDDYIRDNVMQHVVNKKKEIPTE